MVWTKTVCHLQIDGVPLSKYKSGGSHLFSYPCFQVWFDALWKPVIAGIGSTYRGVCTFQVDLSDGKNFDNICCL
jgi:hypothetical protein